MKLDKFHKIVKDTPEDIKEDVKISMDILERIDELLQEKFQGKQKLLADKLGKTEAEVSKWLNGVQNFTIKTLVKLQVAFGADIIAVCTNHHKNSTFTQVKLSSKKLQTYCEVDSNGNLIDDVRVYKRITIKSPSSDQQNID